MGGEVGSGARNAKKNRRSEQSGREKDQRKKNPTTQLFTKPWLTEAGALL